MNWSTLVLVGASIAMQLPAVAQSDKTAWQEGLEVYWTKLEHDFKDSLHSPLPVEERAHFKGLERFPVDPDYRIMARFKAEQGPVFGMRTTSEREPKYRKVGTLTFSIHGEEEVLTVYRNIDLSLLMEYKNHLFVPFTDLTNGESTYGGGRYVDLEGPLGEEVELDLNRAYNPYCAYGGAYSCPIPPKENHLEVEVRAGVMKFH